MPAWSCGATSCPTHRNPDDHCSTGPWRCKRVRPACATHHHWSERCREDETSSWTCGAQSCPTHGNREHRCDPPARWRCNIVRPPCPGHRSREDRCTPERARIREAALCGSNQQAGSACCNCPETVRVRVTELQEVHDFEHTEQLRDAAPRRQYVNLDDRVEPDRLHVEYGRTIRFKARVQWDGGDRSGSLAGIPVYFYATAHPENRANLTGPARAGFFHAGSGILQFPVTADRDGWTPVLTFHLSLYGGDRFRIGATATGDYQGGRTAGWYTVWRRMWCELLEMERPGGGRFQLPSGALDLFRASYHDVFLELADAHSRDEGVWRDTFETAGAAWAWADLYTSVQYTPFKIQLACLDHMDLLASRAEREFELSCREQVNTPESTSFLPYNYNRRQWLISAQYRNRAGAWVDFGPQGVTLASHARRTPLCISFEHEAESPSAGSPLRVRVSVYAASGTLGWGGANLHCAIAVGALETQFRGDDLLREAAATAIHEAGHGFALVRNQAWESTAASQQAHCRDAACVMYAWPMPGQRLTFDEGEPGCHHYLRGKDLSRNQMTVWSFPR